MATLQRSLPAAASLPFRPPTRLRHDSLCAAVSYRTNIRIRLVIWCLKTLMHFLSTKGIIFQYIFCKIPWINCILTYEYITTGNYNISYCSIYPIDLLIKLHSTPRTKALAQGKVLRRAFPLLDLIKHLARTKQQNGAAARLFPKVQYRRELRVHFQSPSAAFRRRRRRTCWH